MPPVFPKKLNPGRVITKFDFSALLSLAWGKTMVPSVICSGFKRSGIYPFNPQAIDYGVVVEKSTAQENSKAMDLSHEQIQLFERRYDEGYDFPDPVYLKWLEITHPKKGQTEDQQSESISNDDSGEFSGEQEHQVHRINEEAQSPDPYSEQYNENVSLSELVYDSEILGLERSSVESVTELQVNANTAATTSVPTIEPPEHEGELNYISKYLIQHVPVKKVQKASKRATSARVLTSDECAKNIFEQDEKRRREKEEKVARKVEREQKKKEREEAAKQKAEKIAKRKEEAAKKKEEAVKKREEAARKKAEKSANFTSHITRQCKRANVTDLSAAKRRKRTAEEESLPSEDEAEIDELQTNSTTRASRTCTQTVSTDFDPNQCCVCFRKYEEDVLEETELNWIKCVCERWVHEDCVNEIIMDKNGRELICPYCVP